MDWPSAALHAFGSGRLIRQLGKPPHEPNMDNLAAMPAVLLETFDEFPIWPRYGSPWGRKREPSTLTDEIQERHYYHRFTTKSRLDEVHKHGNNRDFGSRSPTGESFVPLHGRVVEKRCSNP